jgi:hypothetical protein
MDKLSIISRIREEEQISTLRIEVWINNKPLVDYEEDVLGIGKVELFPTSKRDGEFFITTCICGCPGCAGIYKGVQVSRDQKQIHWRIPASKKVPEQSYTFDLQSYLEELEKGQNDFLKLVKENPDLQLHPAMPTRTSILFDTDFI